MYETKKLAISDLNRLQSMEKEIGCCLVAIQKPPQPASISEAGLKKLQKLEKDLDTIIVAYECPGSSKSTGEVKKGNRQCNLDKDKEQDCCPARSELD